MKNLFNKKNSNLSTEGLPEIAGANAKRNPVVLVVLGIVIAIFCTTYFYAKPQKKAEAIHEEVYTVENTIIPTETHKQLSPAIETQPVKMELKPEEIAFIQTKQKELQQRLSAPLVLVNNRQDKKQDASPKEKEAVTANDPNTRFMQQVSNEDSKTENATRIGPLNTLIAEGSLIHAILESAANSDLPGYLRAIVSEASYSEDGSKVLIPVGSRLIGQYKSGIQQGQSRVFIVWKRLITPTGISINLGSPGVDSLGVAGSQADEVDRHFWERFGRASLLSIIGVGAANLGVNNSDQENSASVYRSAIASSFSQSAGQSLQQDGNISPTLKSYQGKPIIVFVAHDLNFEKVMQQSQPKFNLL